LDVGFEAGEILVEDQVDHAAHGIGAIGCRSAAGHHIDSLYQARRDGGEIDAAAQQVR
jgi:hypothetical protein